MEMDALQAIEAYNKYICPHAELIKEHENTHGSNITIYFRDEMIEIRKKLESIVKKARNTEAPEEAMFSKFDNWIGVGKNASGYASQIYHIFSNNKNIRAYSVFMPYIHHDSVILGKIITMKRLTEYTEYIKIRDEIRRAPFYHLPENGFMSRGDNLQVEKITENYFTYKGQLTDYTIEFIHDKYCPGLNPFATKDCWYMIKTQRAKDFSTFGL